jgi:hypothetical protein
VRSWNLKRDLSDDFDLCIAERMHQIANILEELCSYPENYGATPSTIGRQTPDISILQVQSRAIVAIAIVPIV